MSQEPSADRKELAISHARSYTTPGVRTFYDRGRCLHFAECVRGLAKIFARMSAEVLLVGARRSPAFWREILDALEGTLARVKRVEFEGAGHEAPFDHATPQRVRWAAAWVTSFAEHGLTIDDPISKRWLRNTQPFGRTAEVQLLGGDHEGAQPPQIRRRVGHFLCNIQKRMAGSRN